MNRDVIRLTMPKRISIRAALLGVAIVAMGFAFGPNLYRRVKYFDKYQQLTNRAAQWNRTDGSVECYIHQAPNGRLLGVFTSEQEFPPPFGPYRSPLYNERARVDPERFFVVPPGIWVNTIDQVFATWDNYD